MVHQLLPLAALALNVGLVAIGVVRNPGSRLNRVFAYFASAMALWNLGVFMLRGTADATEAARWEIVIHVGVIVLPALYYHFLLIFLDATHRRRGWLAAAYLMSLVFLAANLGLLPGFMIGVRSTHWGWAPAAGPLYHLFTVYFYLVFVGGFVHLAAARRAADSAFRRNRTVLVMVGTSAAIVGGFVDILRFTLSGIAPAAERLYPVGIPANMACAVTFGIAIVRYRMFDVSVAVKKIVLYSGFGAALTTAAVLVTWILERVIGLRGLTSMALVVPLGFVLGFLLTPLARPVEIWIERSIFSRPRGCHDTLLQLSKRMATMLQLDQLVETLVPGLVRGIPVTHCALLLDDGGERYRLRREESASGERVGVTAVPAGGPLAAWLASTPGILVKEEALLDRRMARYFGSAPGELEAINATLIVPLRIESKVKGILLLGEKLSGEVFTPDELEVLAVLANQAAISMENARLYEQAECERRRTEVLYEVSRRLACVHEPHEILELIVKETTRLLQVEMAAVRLAEGDDLTLAAHTGPVERSRIRPRLAVGESLTGLVVAENTAVMVEDVLTDDRLTAAHKQFSLEQGYHGFLGVPIRAEGGAIGVLYAVTTKHRLFEPDEVSLLSALADQASVSVERSRLEAQRHQAEDALRQSEKLATMGQLLAGVAHELNNPLTVIVGFGTLLSNKLNGSPMHESARQITVAAERCGRIVRNFLALARKHPPERSQVSLNQVVSDAVELVMYPLKVDGIKATLDLAAELPMLWADPHQLQQVVVNLLTNAHHAVRAGTTREIALTTRLEPHHRRVVLRVADSGPGIPPEIQRRIFEPFFTTKPVGQGTGLGLSLCHGIVEGHGGTIRVDSRPGEGAVFTVELPVEDAIVESDPSGRAPLDATVDSKRVLIVDDEPAVASLLAQIVSQDGHRVEIAGSAEAALGKLTQQSYDLIVSDVRMPALDGPQFYREVAERHPTRRPPFVFVTGDVLGDDTRRFLDEARAPHLSKPFALDEVRRTLQVALSSA